MKTSKLEAARELLLELKLLKKETHNKFILRKFYEFTPDQKNIVYGGGKFIEIEKN